MSKKEEALRRSVLSREGPGRDRAAKRRALHVLSVATMAGGVAMGGLPQRRVNHDAQRGQFSGGDFHPDMCSCAKCTEWRKAERHRQSLAPKPWE